MPPPARGEIVSPMTTADNSSDMKGIRRRVVEARMTPANSIDLNIVILPPTVASSPEATNQPVAVQMAPEPDGVSLAATALPPNSIHARLDNSPVTMAESKTPLSPLLELAPFAMATLDIAFANAAPRARNSPVNVSSSRLLFASSGTVTRRPCDHIT